MIFGLEVPAPTYVIVYREVKETSGQRRDMPESLSGSRRSSSLPQLPLTSSTNCSMDELLQLIRQLYINTEHSSEQHSAEFLSKKITNKLVTQIQDPLVLSAASLPGCLAPAAAGPGAERPGVVIRTKTRRPRGVQDREGEQILNWGVNVMDGGCVQSLGPARVSTRVTSYGRLL